ncbi:hypothetical protein ABZX74_46665, partial [Streptomyces olivaceoviridis]|uniref:hypothetical protein n=1 Tax=Streptomyces olivaceoviridis TaxID=1921 RepID=UPI0033A6290C
MSPTTVSVSEPSPLAVSEPSLPVPVVAGSLLREVRVGVGDAGEEGGVGCVVAVGMVVWSLRWLAAV